MSSETNPSAIEGTEIAASIHGIEVPQSPFLTEGRIERINTGKYEGAEINGALALVTSSDRVLELGAGLGIVGAVIAKNTQPEAMVSFEANPNLIPHIRRLYQMNSLSDRIDLRNQVLLATPDRPETVDFHLGNSFLGSSLVAQVARKQRKISVETADFEEVRTQLNPTILVMDIEGGELDLLQDADLTGIRAVILEFHPALYGDSGMRRCKNMLRDQGFIRIDDHSTRTVWACQRTDVTRRLVQAIPDGERRPPMPGAPGANPLQKVENAQVVPADKSGFVQQAGVFDSEGDYCPQAALWRKGRPMTVRPDVPSAPPETLPGRWLWGGVLWDHFGHFIVESTSRLWPLPDLKDEIDGIVFIPKRPQRDDILLGFQRDFLDQLVPGIPVKLAHTVTRVDHLIVPEQGFGLGQITAGSAAFRTTMSQHFARDLLPSGSKKLYISRSSINLKRGGILGEARLESWLAAEGYEVFHPEKHDIPTQIARYKAAEVIVSCEGSALHLFGMIARPNQKVGIVLRRKSKATNLIVRHLKSFTGVSPTTFDAVQRGWTPGTNAKQHKFVGELDMPQLQSLLLRDGFIGAGSTTWSSLSDAEIRDVLGPKFNAIDA